MFPKSKYNGVITLNGVPVHASDTIELLQSKFGNELKQDTDSLQFGIQMFVYTFNDLRISFTLLPDNKGIRNINFTKNV